jgi:hypothetical protein
MQDDSTTGLQLNGPFEPKLRRKVIAKQALLKT